MHELNFQKIKKGKTVLYAFIKIVNESNCKPNKLWVDQGREIYNKLMQEWLEHNDILMYSTHNEGKSVIAERFIKTLKPKIFKKMTANHNKSYLPLTVCFYHVTYAFQSESTLYSCLNVKELLARSRREI